MTMTESASLTPPPLQRGSADKGVPIEGPTRSRDHVLFPQNLALCTQAFVHET